MIFLQSDSDSEIFGTQICNPNWEHFGNIGFLEYSETTQVEFFGFIFGICSEFSELQS